MVLYEMLIFFFVSMLLYRSVLCFFHSTQSPTWKCCDHSYDSWDHLSVLVCTAQRSPQRDAAGIPCHLLGQPTWWRSDIWFDLHWFSYFPPINDKKRQCNVTKYLFFNKSCFFEFCIHQGIMKRKEVWFWQKYVYFSHVLVFYECMSNYMDIANIHKTFDTLLYYVNIYYFYLYVINCC